MDPKASTIECDQIVSNSLPTQSTNECIGDISTDTTEKDVSLTTPAASPLDMNLDEGTVSKISQVAEEDELLLANENDASDVESINENADNNLQKVELVTGSLDDISDTQETCILPEEEEQGKEQLSLLSTDDTEEVVSIDDECTDEIVGIRKVASSQSNDDTKVENDEESSLPSNTGTDVSSINDDDEEDLNLIDNQSEPLLTKEKEDIKANFKIILKR